MIEKGSRDKDFRRRVTEQLRSIAQAAREKLRRGEKPALTLVLSDDAKKVIRDWVLKLNPRLSEVTFIGVGVDNKVDRVYAPDTNFSPRSGLGYDGYAGSSVDIEELGKLFDRVTHDGKLDEILFIGHLHPSGETVISGIRHITTPRGSLLYPSINDIKYVKLFVESNPQIHIPYEAIAANTEHGPALRIYSVQSLIKTKSSRDRDLKKIPQQTISL